MLKIINERILRAEEKKEEMILTSALVTEEKNPQDGLLLRVDGYQIWQKDGIIPLLWEHGMDFQGWLPLGSVRNLRVEEIDNIPTLIGEKVYYSPSLDIDAEIARIPLIIYDMRRQRHMNAVSIRFSPIEYEDTEQQICSRWFLFEVSDCVFGADPQAIDIFTPKQRSFLHSLKQAQFNAKFSKTGKKMDGLDRVGTSSIWEKLGNLIEHKGGLNG